MREINVVLNFNGEIVTGTLRVRADYLATEHDRTRLRNLLECNAQVLKMEDVQ